MWKKSENIMITNEKHLVSVSVFAFEVLFLFVFLYN